MRWIDAIPESFPPPHEGEPRHLRDDIRDELADHLECALRREQLRTSDDEAAMKAVLERFGDPKRIARKLWYGAMRERIMKDRLFLVLFMVGLFALIASIVLPWAQQQQRMNEAILKRLEAMTPPPAATRPAMPENWASLTVSVRESNSGRPIKGVRISLSGKPFTDADKDQLNEQTDDQGTVTFGPIRPGPYSVSTSTPPDDAGIRLDASRTVTLYAGQERQVTFTTPQGPINSEVTPHLNSPEPLQKLGCIAVYWIQPRKAIVRDETEWRYGAELVAVGLGTNTWGRFSSHSNRSDDRSVIPSNSNLSCQLEPLGRTPLRCVASDYTISQIQIWQPRGDDCWALVADDLSKDLVASFPVGAYTWEMPLPKELLDRAYQSSRLELPVTCRFAGVPANADEFLIDVSFHRRSVDAKDEESGSSGEFRFTSGGRLVVRDQFESRMRPATQPLSTLRFSKLLTQEARLPLGQYSLYRFNVLRKVKGNPEIPAYELCGSYSISKNMQRLEVRVDRENSWNIQLPPELLKCFDAATQPQ